jgi:hypothetical protein
MADRRTRRPTGQKRDGSSGEVVVQKDGVTISGPEDLVEDFLDGQEIDGRLADPANQQRIPWSELKARRGL